MKLLIYQKLFLNNSTKKIIVIVTVTLWFLVSFAFGTGVYHLESERISDQKKLRRQSIEATLLRVFDGYAKFGDLVNSKGSILEAGKPFGLISFHLCKNGISIPPMPFDDECRNLAGGYVVTFNQENYNVFFEWDEIPSKELLRLFKLVLLASLVSLLLVILVTAVFLRIFRKRLFYIANQISSVSSIDGLEHFKLDVPELRPITTAIRRLFSIVERYSTEISRLKVEEFKNEIAQKVAHDIRSPLSAIQIAVSKLPKSTPEHSLIVGASARIQAIANDLLKTSSREHAFETLLSARDVKDNHGHLLNEPYDIYSSIDAIVREKLLSFHGQLRLEGHETFGLKAVGNKVEIERIVSNLINNAIEATGGVDHPEITVFIRRYEEVVAVHISDNGPGISKEILEKIGAKGATFGKIGGSGLGIYSAKSYLEEIGGRFEIQSQVGVGTLVTIVLPIS